MKFAAGDQQLREAIQISQAAFIGHVAGFCQLQNGGFTQMEEFFLLHGSGFQFIKALELGGAVAAQQFLLVVQECGLLHQLTPFGDKLCLLNGAVPRGARNGLAVAVPHGQGKRKADGYLVIAAISGVKGRYTQLRVFIS